MTLVQIWRLKGGVSRAEAIKSILDCVELADFRFKNIREMKAAELVEEIIKRYDKCASSANVTPMGLRLSLKNPIKDADYEEFKERFHFTVVAEDPSNESRLKLWKGYVTEKKKSPVQATLQHNILMILARDSDEAYDVVAAAYPKFVFETIIVKEIEGPFAAGQILMDVELRTVSITDELITDF